MAPECPAHWLWSPEAPSVWSVSLEEELGPGFWVPHSGPLTGLGLEPLLAHSAPLKLSLQGKKMVSVAGLASLLPLQKAFLGSSSPAPC